MGASQSFDYATAVSKKEPGSTQIFRNPTSKDTLIDGPSSNIKDMKSALLRSFELYKDNPSLGKIIRKQGQKQHIQFITYGQLEEKVRKIGSGIINEKLMYNPEGTELQLVGIFSKNRPEWTIVDIGCIMYKLTSVPLYDTLGEENISYVLNHTQMTTIFVNQSSLNTLKKAKDLGNLKNIINFDNVTLQQRQYFDKHGIAIRNYSQIQQSGTKKQIDYNSQQFKVKPDDCLTFCYTSGTTGKPKGALLSHKNFISFIGGVQYLKDFKVYENDIYLSYLPLPHVLERQILFAGFYAGARGVYHSGDILKIKQDIDLVRPTIFVSVPRLFSRFYEILNKKLGQKQGLIKYALEHGLSKKLNNTVTNGGYTHKVYDKLFFNKTKQALGGRVRVMISGGAPLLPEVHKYMKVTMCCPLLQGYGQTQSTGACFITMADDPELGHIGGPWASIQYKLVDIPEMKYTSQDKDQNGNSTPRGQLWIRGAGVFLGYFKDEQKTKQTLTKDGWLKTGDVGVILPHTKALKIIDRKKNIFKLSQGQYLAAEKIQNAYADYHLIKQMFLHGQSTQNYPIAIIQADKKMLQQKVKSLGLQNASFEQVCQNKTLRQKIISQMNELAKRKGLKGFQMVKNIYIQPSSFQEKKILTNTMKIQRHQARSAYKSQIQQLYKQGILQQSTQNSQK